MNNTSSLNISKQSNYFQYLFLSVFAHILFLWASNSIDLKIEHQNDISEVNILIEQPEKLLVKKQIVSPSDISESDKSPDSELLSDKNTVVEKQSLKRGDTPLNKIEKRPLKPTPPIKQSQTKTQKPAIKKSENQVTDAHTKNMNSKSLLDSISKSTMSALNSEKIDSQKNLPSEEVKENDASSAESRLNSIAGISGNPDLLTGIPDGEITLLNAKADRFAVFVRRVALQVFSNLRNSNWYEMGNLSQGLQTEEVTVRAILDASGKFESLELLNSSKVDIFDRAINRSVRKGAWDRNPPPAALTPDGKIKFIFKAKAWVRGSPSGRSRQWIQLVTGLE